MALVDRLPSDAILVAAAETMAALEALGLKIPKTTTRTSRMLRNPVVLLVGCAVLTGCFFYASSTGKQQSFSKAEVKKIEPGKTTKEDILKWFGPPLAMARKGDEDKFIPAAYVRVDTFLEVFAAKHTLTENDVIYYYRNVETTSAGLAVSLYSGYNFVGAQEPRSPTAKLWVLIDNRSGIVEDYSASETR